MTDLDQRPAGGRFGTATPGARPERPSLESLLGAPARKRQPAWRRLTAALAGLALAGGGYAAGHFLAPGSPAMASVVVTRVALPQGARLTAGDLRVLSIKAGNVPAGALGPAAANSTAGLAVSQPVPAGTIVMRSDLTQPGSVPGHGMAQVGVALKPGEAPAGGLTPGEHVVITALPQSAQGQAPKAISLATATVWSASSPDSSGTVSATVLVPRALAVTLASYAASGEVALVALPSSAQ